MTTTPTTRLEPGAYDDGVFDVGRERGFLPKVDLPARLEGPFEPVQALLDAMPVWLDAEAQTPGLLATPGAIEAPVLALPDLSAHVEALDPAVEADAQQLAILFRGYSFLTSAYLLEPAHHAQRGGGEYGQARRHLPPQLARPLAAAAERLGQGAWLDYHYAYSLCNYVKRDPTLTGMDQWHWSNLGMACRFSGMPDEAGFIMLHVHINGHGGAMVGSIFDALDAATRWDAGDADALPELRAALAENLATMREINAVRRLMWQASRPERYNDFRVFIMGVKGNEELFGPGVVYEGVERFGGEPQQFRGQTGAQDDIIPTEDIFSGVIHYYPQNKLTEYLMDLRQYRPVVIQRFFDDLREVTAASRFHEIVRRDPEAAALMAGVVEQIYLFRNGHWQFVQRYIMANTRYAKATGGTPITTWLPNQIEACLKYLEDLRADARSPGAALSPEAEAVLAEIERLHAKRCEILHDQVEALKQTDYDAALIYQLNQEQLDERGPRA